MSSLSRVQKRHVNVKNLGALQGAQNIKRPNSVHIRMNTDGRLARRPNSLRSNSLRWFFAPDKSTDLSSVT